MVHLPFDEPVASVIFSEGVAAPHATRRARRCSRVSRLLVPGGRFLFYVYRRKGPVREFTDDYIRDALQGMGQSEAWEALLPLSKLGQSLGELDVTLDIPRSRSSSSEIPAGHDRAPAALLLARVQDVLRPRAHPRRVEPHQLRLVRARNAHRQTPEQVREWCAEAGLEIEREASRRPGITIVARRVA